MGRTVPPSRRRLRLRHRPQLEHLDDRCLLSTGLATQMAHPIAVDVPNRPADLVRPGRPHAGHARRPRAWLGSRTAVAKEHERPAGTLAAGATSSLDSIIGASQVRSAYNVDGTGMTVAVIDTGVDYNNPALGGGFGPGAKVIAGYDFADNSSDPLAATSQHGTAVAGLIAARGPNDPGVAPGVNIVALRVTDSSNTASLNSMAGALQWVIDHHAEYNITVVNISLSDDRNYAQNWFAQAGGPAEQITSLIGQLRALNIPVVTATGNSFDGKAQGEGFPSVVAGTISVTATNLSGQLLFNAQRSGPAIGGSSATTLAAPGDGFSAPSGDSGTSGVDGTSFAAPLVSGAVVLLQQIYASRFHALPSVDQLTSWLQQGSDPISDPATGITLGQLDIPRAAGLIPAAPSQPAPVITTPPTPLVVPAATVAPAAPPAPITPVAPAASTSQVVSTAQVPTASPTSAPHGAGERHSPAAPARPNLDRLLRTMNVWAAARGWGGWTSGSSSVNVWNAS